MVSWIVQVRALPLKSVLPNPDSCSESHTENRYTPSPEFILNRTYKDLPSVPNPSFSTPMDIPKNFDLVHIWAVNWIDLDLFSA